MEFIKWKTKKRRRRKGKKEKVQLQADGRTDVYILINSERRRPPYIPLLVIVVDLKCGEALTGNHLIQAAMSGFAIKHREGAHKLSTVMQRRIQEKNTQLTNFE